MAVDVELCLACHCSDSDEMFVLCDRLHLSFVIPITSETANLHFAEADNKHTHQPVEMLGNWVSLWCSVPF